MRRGHSARIQSRHPRLHITPNAGVEPCAAGLTFRGVTETVAAQIARGVDVLVWVRNVSLR